MDQTMDQYSDLLSYVHATKKILYYKKNHDCKNKLISILLACNAGSLCPKG